MIKKVSEILSHFKARLSISLLLLMVSNLTHAEDKTGDIVKTIINGAVGKTLSKDGYVWSLLITITFVVAGFHAAVKKDPKEFISAFVIMAIISTVIGVFLTF